MLALCRRLFLLLLPVLSLLPLACCGEEADPVQTLLRQAARDPQLRNERTFNELTHMVLANPKRYARFINSRGRVDVERLQEAYSQIAERTDAQSESTWIMSDYGGALSGDLRLRLMLERSGSMTGFDSRNSSGDFKRVLSEIITRFPSPGQSRDNQNHAQNTQGEQSEILIVNDDLYPYPASFSAFLQDKDIFSSTKHLGNPAYTDFAKIFDYALTDTVPERITVLVTDLIYSPEESGKVSATKIFNEEGALATSLFKDHKDKSMLIVRLRSDFDGAYYPYCGNPFEWQGKRPYFMIITGSAAAMSKLRNDERYAGFASFSSLPGYEQQYFFNRHPLPPQWWSVLPRKNSSDGAYTLAGGDAERGAHAIKDVSPAEQGLTLRVAVDLSEIPAQEEYLLDPANYSLSSDAPASITAIERVKPEMASARDKRYFKHATHLFTLNISGRTMPEKITVELFNKLPAWVSEYSANSDGNPLAANFSATTFGLEPFLSGVYKAYYGTASVPVFTGFTIDVK